MEDKVQQQTRRDNETSNIRREPYRISHYLQNRRAIIVRIEAALIVRFTPVPQRIVHLNQRFPVLPRFGIANSHEAREVPGHLSALIKVVTEIKQG
jgi:hypothetical protein